MANTDVMSNQFMMRAVRQIEIPRGYRALGYLPFVDVTTDDLTWDVVKDEQNLAGLYAVNGEILPGHDPIYSQMFADIIRVGASRIIPEDVVRKLRDPQMVGITGPGYVADVRATAERKVAERYAFANSEVDATIEYLGMKALQGYVPWPPPEWDEPPGPANEMTKFAIDFGFRHRFDASAGLSFNGQSLGAGYYWTDLTNSDPVKDIMGVMTVLTEESGIIIEDYDILISRTWAYWLIQNSTFRDLLKQSGEAPRLMRFNMIREYINDMTGWSLQFYDAMYTKRTVGTSDASDITIERKRMLPSNKILFVPRGSGRIGDFPTSPSKANNWRTGKFTWREEKVNPWVTTVGVGINCFPRITIPDALAVLTIAADGWNPSNITP